MAFGKGNRPPRTFARKACVALERKTKRACGEMTRKRHF
jgi:hypothetical protein